MRKKISTEKNRDTILYSIIEYSVMQRVLCENNVQLFRNSSQKLIAVKTLKHPINRIMSLKPVNYTYSVQIFGR